MRAFFPALRFAWRDGRRIVWDYKILVLCLAIGVAAVTGVQALTDAVSRGLARDGRALIGGDVSFSRVQAPLSPEEQSFVAQGQVTTTTASLRAMVAAPSGDTALADLRAVEPNYPLVGAIRTEPDVAIAALDGPDGLGALLDPALIARLGLKVGDAVRIGGSAFLVRAAILDEPDRLISGGFAPRMIISRDGLERAGLAGPESLLRWTTRVMLPAQDGQPAGPDVVTAFVDRFKTRFPQAGVEIRTPSTASPQVGRIIDRIGKFLLAMGLLSVVVGGVGVWNAVSLFVERRRASVAILKVLGASGSFVFGTTLAEILGLAALGVGLGLLLGASLPFALAPLIVRAGLTGFAPALSLASLGSGAAVGFGAALLFSILPAARAHDVPGAILLRGEADGASGRLRPRYLALALACLVLFVLAVGASAGNFLLAAAALLGAAIFGLLFEAAARLLPRLISLLPRPAAPAPALAFSNLRRATRLSRAAAVSLGLGLTVLAATSEVTAGLRAQLSAGFPEQTPNLFLLGLPAQDADDLRAFLRKSLPGAQLDEAPLMRGRIVEIKGQPAETVAAGSQQWVLEGDRGITFSATPPRDSTLVAGQWWPPDYEGPPLVSVGAEAARSLGLALGDEIAVNVAGRRIAARVANFRDINWASFGINFVLVFSPKPFDQAPHTRLFTVAAPDLDQPPKEAALVRELASNWPGLVAINVHAMLAQARGLVDKATLGVAVASLFTLVAAALVLAGAAAADGRARARTVTILKTLGGSRTTLLKAALLEWATLGLFAGLIAVAAGSLVAWALLRFLLNAPFAFALGPLLLLLAGAVAGIVLVSFAANRRMLNELPARVLRRL